MTDMITGVIFMGHSIPSFPVENLQRKKGLANQAHSCRQTVRHDIIWYGARMTVKPPLFTKSLDMNLPFEERVGTRITGVDDGGVNAKLHIFDSYSQRAKWVQQNRYHHPWAPAEEDKIAIIHPMLQIHRSGIDKEEACNCNVN